MKYKTKSEQLIDIVDETYLGRDKATEIFVNPDSSEVKDLTQAAGNNIRFLANDETKEVFIWDAKVLHYQTFEMLDVKPGSIFLTGHAVFRGGILTMNDSDQLNRSLRPSPNDAFYNQILKTDWSWVEKYIKVSKFVGDIIRRRGVY